MAIATTYVPTVFTARDRFSDVVRNMTRNTRTFSAGLNRLDQRMNRVLGLQGMGANIRTGAQFGLGLLVYQAGKDAIEYEKAMASLSAVTGTTFGSMRGEIESLAKESSRSVIDVTKSFEVAGSKMSEYLDNASALKDLSRASILMADAGRMELEPSIESLTGVLNIFKKEAKDAYDVVNKLSAGETVGSVSIAQTASILPQFGAQAVRANASVSESIALVQTLTKSLGVEGVGRGLRNILFDISSTETWDKNRWKAIKMAGVDFKFVTNNAGNLVERLRELKKLSNVKGATELFFKRVNSIAANTLFQNFDQGESNFVSFLDKIKKLDDAQTKANKNNDTFAKGFKDLKASFTNFIVTTDNANESLQMLKGTMAWMKDNMGTLINGIVYAGLAFAGIKLLVMGARLAMWGMSVTMGLTAARAGAMAIAMQGNAVAIGAFNLAMTGWALPVLGAAAAIGVLGYAVYKFSKRHETEADRQVANIAKVNGALRGSTAVQKAELEKQLAQKTKFLKLFEALDKKPLTKEQIEANNILAGKNAYRKRQNEEAIQRKFEQDLKDIKAQLAGFDSSGYADGYYQNGIKNPFELSQLAKIPEAQALYNSGMSFDDIEKFYPDQLTTVSEKKHQLEIIIKNLEGVTMGSTVVPYIEGNAFSETMTALYAPKTSKTTQGTQRKKNIFE